MRFWGLRQGVIGRSMCIAVEAAQACPGDGDSDLSSFACPGKSERDPVTREACDFGDTSRSKHVMFVSEGQYMSSGEVSLRTTLHYPRLRALRLVFLCDLVHVDVDRNCIAWRLRCSWRLLTFYGRIPLQQ